MATAMGAVGLTVSPVSFDRMVLAAAVSTALKQSNLLFSSATCAVPSLDMVKAEKRVSWVADRE